MNEQGFAEKLIALRRAKGATQDEVAKYLSLSGKTVSKWETGASMPDLPTLVKLSGYFGITTDTLLGLSDGKSDDTSESVASLFDGLDRRKSILKAFEAERAIIGLYRKPENYIFEGAILAKDCAIDESRIDGVLADLTLLRVIYREELTVNNRKRVIFHSCPGHCLIALFLIAKEIGYRGGYTLQSHFRSRPLLQ